MREIGVDELFGSSRDPFVRHHLDPSTVTRAWVSGAATVVQDTRGRPQDVPTGPVLVCLGPPGDLEPLMHAVCEVGPRPWRVSVERTSYDALPAPWRHAEHHEWHWMLTRTRPEPATLPVEVVGAPDEIDAVLDVANPGSFARPGTPGVEGWAGVRVDGRLVGVGALLRQADGTGHLRGISVLPEATGRGVGRALSAELTRRGLTGGSGVVTLGVYSDNAAAITIYDRLGYAVAHTFVSGRTGC